MLFLDDHQLRQEAVGNEYYGSRALIKLTTKTYQNLAKAVPFSKRY